MDIYWIYEHATLFFQIPGHSCKETRERDSCLVLTAGITYLELLTGCLMKLIYFSKKGARQLIIQCQL